MSSSVHEFLCELFGSTEQADCTIKFYSRVDANNAEPVSKRQRTDGHASGEEPVAQPEVQQLRNEVVIGDPLPGHLLVICGGSPLFRATAVQWQQGNNAGSAPVFRVLLGSPEELPYVRSAVRFMYTNKLGVNGACALLHVRRFGGELQIAGCIAACDSALTDLIAASPAGAHRLAGVADIFLHRALLPTAPDARAAVHMLMDGCREALVRNSGSINAGAPVDAGGPSLGELLAWAFLDAPSLLSDPAARSQMHRLSEQAMEALLGSNGFATDNEASVLLVLADWLHRKPSVSKGARERLCRLIRVSQLDGTYLHVVLPEIAWFPISPDEYRFVCAYAQASATKREYMRRSAVNGPFDLTSAWYAAGRPGSGTRAVTCYEWHLTKHDVHRLGGKGTGEVSRSGRFSSGVSEVVSCGFKWRPEITHVKGSGVVGVYLWCLLPEVLGIAMPESLVGVVCPGPVQLKVYRWDAGGTAAGGTAGGSAAGGSAGGGGTGKGEAWSTSFADKFVRISYGMGESAALQLGSSAANAQPQQQGGVVVKQEQPSPQSPQTPQQPAPSAPQQQPSSAPQQGAAGAASTGTVTDRLALWAPYLHEGKLHGVLQWA